MRMLPNSFTMKRSLIRNWLAAGLMFLAGCSGSQFQARMLEVEKATVAILCPKLVDDEQILVPCCAGFMVESPVGPVLITAAHCIKPAGGGPIINYVPFSVWNGTVSDYRRASLLWTQGDIAALWPEEKPEAVLQSEASSFDPREPVTAVRLDSALSGAIRYGNRTDLDIVQGWSGAPMLNSRGKVIGVMTRCKSQTADVGPCLPNSGIFEAL